MLAIPRQPVVYKKSFRNNLNLETITNKKNFFEASKKDEVLKSFIDDLYKNKADVQDYVNYLFAIIFNQKIDDHWVTQEQKDRMRYLCANEYEMDFLSKNITRGQIKLWTVLYQIQNKQPAKYMGELILWIKAQKQGQGRTIDEADTPFMEDLKQCWGYFESMHHEGAYTYLGNKKDGYEISYRTETLNTHLINREKNKERMDYLRGIRTIVTDLENIDHAKVAELKKKSCQLEHLSFFHEEIAQLKNKDIKVFNISDNVSLELRKTIYLKNQLLIMSKDKEEERIKQSNLIVQFVADSIQHLYYSVFDLNEFYLYEEFNKYYNEIIDERNDFKTQEELDNNVLLRLINNNIQFICNPNHVEFLQKLIKNCFENGLLKIEIINCNFEISFPKQFLFDESKETTKEDNILMRNLINLYCDYIINNNIFLGHADLNMLKSIPVFKPYKDEIEAKLLQAYSNESAHIGGSSIRGDGNCLLSFFIREFLLKILNKQKDEELILA